MLVSHRYISVGGNRTHLLHDGNPIETLFLHGAGGSAWTFEATLEAMPSMHGWACADLLGYGDSSWLADDSYCSRTQAEQLISVIDLLEVRHLNIVGFSWGALIALEIASRDSRIGKLAIIDMAPSSSLPPTRLPKLGASYPTMPDAVEDVFSVAPRASRRVAERDAFLSTRPCQEGFCKKIDPVLLARWQFREEDHWQAWRGNDRETLIIRGEHSPVLSTDDAHAMVESTRNAALTEITGCGHLIPLERPGELAAVLAEFIGV